MTTTETTNHHAADDGDGNPSPATAAPVAYLSKTDILGADDLAYEDVDCPEWGGTVRVRAMSGTDRNAYQAACQVTRNGVSVFDYTNISAKMCRYGIVDADGALMFTPQEIAALGRKSSAALERVGKVISRLSGLSDDSADEAGKDSEPTPSDGSTSD